MPTLRSVVAKTIESGGRVLVSSGASLEAPIAARTADASSSTAGDRGRSVTSCDVSD